MSLNRTEQRMSLRDVFSMDPSERPALLWSFLFFFALLCGYYMVRPLRESIIAGAGGGQIPRMFTITFIVMMILVPIWGKAVAVFPRRILMPRVFMVVILILAYFFLAMKLHWGDQHRYFAIGFSVFISVFNLFLVSVFWSFMTDIFEPQQARRLFSVIAAGGTIGGIAGAAITSALAKTIGNSNVLLLALGFFILCVVAITKLLPWAKQRDVESLGEDRDEAIGGSPFAGATAVMKSPLLIALSVLMFLGVSVGTVLYNMQADLANQNFPDANARTAFFGRVDLAVNLFVIVTQLTLTRWIYARFGIAPLLIVPMVLIMCGLGTVAMLPVWIAVTATQVVTRGSNFALLQPGRESIFTLVDRETRYKAKNFIDTVVYRGADVVFSWLFQAMKAMGTTISQFAGIWFFVALANLLVVLFILKAEKNLPRAEELGSAKK